MSVIRGMLLLLLVSAASCALVKLSPMGREGEYIVTLDDDVTAAEQDALAVMFGAKKVTIGSFRGLLAKLSAAEVELLAETPGVKEIESNADVEGTGWGGRKHSKRRGSWRCPDVQPAADGDTLPCWGQCRTTTRTADEAAELVFKHNARWGRGVDVYVMDTGINCSHPDFGDRCNNTASFIPYEPYTDLNGHGTWCASIAAGNVWGIAKSANIIDVKVLDGTGWGSWEGVFEGLEWIVENAKATGRPSVISMSLGDPPLDAADAAVNATMEAGIPIVVAAGNGGESACNWSPARASLPIVVGATGLTEINGTNYDRMPSWSNSGSCVSLFAPGVRITGADLEAWGGVGTFSGTSAAAPYAAGVAAMYLGMRPRAGSFDVKHFLVESALQNAGILDIGEGSPDKLLHARCGGRR